MFEEKDDVDGKESRLSIDNELSISSSKESIQEPVRDNRRKYGSESTTESKGQLSSSSSSGTSEVKARVKFVRTE